ncbi:BTAD domain-containing putative transcriptional regulator [Micromonospora sp. NPDC051925]|uniref:BTAD domain-containing putative transcriptional regulator n=1 Tax=Micromonospora sp. NPDC051925 TaxID=3364288 RepID=UPI0037CC983E
MTGNGTAASTPDIRLLGPLEVSADGGPPVRLGGPRQRTLLGLLALRAPGVVSVPHLIDGIWGEDPPGSATKTLHAHVAYLRRSLTAGGLAGLITTRPPGYSLAVATDRVDVRRFEDLVRRGRAALASDAVDAARNLREALRLWRGELLADCPLGDWARAESAALREARLYAREDLIAAELALGQHTRMAAELEALVASEPLRERLWELLIIALHRCDRQADALAAYRRARAVLVAELGLEPGPALRRLEASILAGAELDAGVGVPATPASAAPSAGLPEPMESTLPVPLTNLVGRRADIAEVADLLVSRRLITLTGVGGCGKTRMAVAVATTVDDRYESGVRFVDLTGTSDPELLGSMLAATLGLPQRPDLGPLDLLTRHLRPLRLLLVLDNCEHLVDAAAALVESLLTTCPGLRVLATSREALGVPGELAWPVPPLSAPAHRYDRDRRAEVSGGLAGLRDYDAVRLFLDRAAVAAVRELSDADAPALAAICAGLDGLPLAVELAAARTTVLTLQEIAERIHDPGLLRTAKPGNRGHHHALDATIAWSYQLLDPALRSSFRRLAVFQGGFTLDAVEAVSPQAAGRAIDILGDLVDKSLVVVDRRRDRARYRLLETIRRYADERLGEWPEEAAEARRNHAAHYRSLAEDIDKNLHGPELERLLDRLTVEHDNLVAVLAWYAQHGSGLDELRFAAALARYCHLRGRYREGRRWLEEALSRSGDDTTPELARALSGVAYLAFFDCDYASASRHGERALRVQRELGNLPGTARSLSLLASIDRERGRYASALTRYEEVAAIYRNTTDGRDGARDERRAGDEQAILDERGVADTLQMAGFTSWLAGDLERAGRLIDDALARFHLLKDPEGVASARIHLAAVAHYQGQHARARWLAEDALARFRELDFKEGVAWALNIAGLIAQHDGESQRAVDLLRASLEIHCEVGDRWRAASLLEALAGVLARGSEPAVAAELLGAAAAMRDAIGTPVPAQELPARDETMDTVRRTVGDREYYAAWARGETLRLGHLPARLAELAPPDAPQLQLAP